MTSAGTLGGRSHHWLGAAAAFGCVVTLAACGGSGSKPSASAGPYGPTRSPAALSRCMRANGLSGFPDPVAGPGGVGLPLGVNTDGSLTAAGKTFAGPAVRSAEQACKAYLPPAGGPPPQVSAEQQRRALTFARCMRAHGVPSFPDPNFSGGAGAQKPVGLNPQAPAFRFAARACGAVTGGNAIQIPG
jgi:hypothetical protein